MNKNSLEAGHTIEFGADIAYLRAATSVVRATLAKTHGRVFADEFIVCHGEAIKRAVRGRFNGRIETYIRMELQTLKMLEQAGRACE